MSVRRVHLPEEEALWRRDVERRLRALETAGRLTNASIGSGGLVVKDGGVISVEGGAVTVRDGSGTRLVELTSSGLLVYEADGETVSARLDAGGVAQEVNAEADQTVLAETEFTSTGFVDVIDADLEIPSAWGKYTVTAWFVGTYSDTGGVATSLDLRARFDGVAGDTRTFGSPEPVERRYPISHVEQWTGRTATGTRTVEVQGSLAASGGGQAIGVQNAKLVVQATRTG